MLALVGPARARRRPAGESLPYGALKRLEIARALATEPKVLLLDEPAAGCNAVETEEVDAVIQKIAAQGITVVLVEHDMQPRDEDLEPHPCARSGPHAGRGHRRARCAAIRP